ncbi:ClbS/DfsB family four-helix bundle protein [Candidatus Villigracilis saccharophilus]|uniref:ClbS/DfsB family four-helix bundle protein n=1 Tax=Candidatus Villigracilis saccharophilus TaxID=3140684 RepID=UPI003135853C|nr:ClbS/DfsB family four-helix bundle protein [Anaerolineales bacterium]
MTEQWIPKDKQELMSAIEREWILLRAVAEKLTDRQMTSPDEGGWSPRDNLAHLTEWMKVLMGYHMDHRPSHEVLGVSPAAVKDWDFNIINPLLFERNRERSRQDVLDEMMQVYRQLTNKLDSMTFENLMAPRHPDDPEKRPLVLWVLGDTIEHFEEHRKTIEKTVQA